MVSDDDERGSDDEDEQCITMMLLKKRESGYREQTAPTVTRKRSYSMCVTDAKGESKKDFHADQVTNKLIAVVVWGCGGEVMQVRERKVHHRAVGKEDPSETQ